jgi:hypothetical protein
MASNPRSFPALGGCACGKIRYRMETHPIIVHCCHCTWCQRESGSSFALNAVIEATNVTLLPPIDSPSASPCEPLVVPTPSLSGRGQIFYRCPTCYIALWSNYSGGGPIFYFIRAGTLDRKDIVKPDINIYVASKQPWVELDKSIPAFDEFYKPADVWPKESQERMAAARKATSEPQKSGT